MTIKFFILIMKNVKPRKINSNLFLFIQVLRVTTTMIDKTIVFFGEFHKRHNDSFLIILTESPKSDFISYLNKFNISPANYLIKQLKQKDVNSIQMIADMAFLIRDDLILNHHSFPTKFAEYLASGVPVLTTLHIHTIAPMVRDYELGEIIDIKDNYRKEIDMIYDKYKTILK